MPLGQGLHVAGGDIYRVDPLQRAYADAQRRRPEVVETAERVLAGQAFLHQALQVAVRGGAAGAGAPGHFAEGQLAFGVGQVFRKRAAMDTDWMVPERFSPGASGISFAGGCEVFNGSVSSPRLIHRLRSALRWRGRRP